MVGSRSSLAVFLWLLSASLCSLAQDNSENRINQAIDVNQRVILNGSAHPLARPASDLGRVDGAMKLHGISLVFKPSPAQQTALEELLRQQQDRSSPNYHKWLTPQQYAGRFGLNANDLSKVTSWLRSEGFSIDRVARSRTQVSFSGTVAQVEAAFRTEMRHYLIDGETHFANATDLALPAALAGTVRGVRNLHDFHLKSHYTDGSGNHSMAPDDFATIYDLKPLYAAGFDGTGQSIAVIGQTGIYTTDIDAFRSAAGLPARTSSNFQQFQVLNSGSATPTLANLTDADIGLEWSQAVAPQATILYFFVGDNPNFTGFDALQDAIDSNLAPVISITNGKCEASLGSTEVLTVQGWAQQANSQGQTIVAAAGDEGAADCDGKVASAMLGLAVDAPASIPEVTGVGGTEFNGDLGSPATYWNATNTATGGSALSYIQEVVWNDTLFNGVLSAGGGGASTIFAKPTWQVATSMPADGMRDVPDISLAASPDHDPHLLCSNNFCKVGFTDGNGNLPIDLQIAGGTSVSAPTFAGIVAIINQVTGSRQGNINPTLYSLSVSTPSAFHDIISNSNVVPCTVRTPDCQSNGSMGFLADVGYDQASGLGSVDANVFVNAWPLEFSLTANPNPIVIARGETGISNITLNSIGSLPGTVTLSCTSASSGGPTCAISPTSVTAANPTATLTISAFSPGASPAKPGLGFGGPAGSSSTSLAGPFPPAFYHHEVDLLSLLLFAFLVAGLAASKRHVSCAFGLLSITTALILIPACGSHNSNGGSFCTTAPGVPTGLAASSTAPTGTTLNWTAASAGANCSVNSYAVFQNGNSTPIGTTSSTNFDVVGLSFATTYSFTVAAGDAAGVSAQSSPLSVTTASPTTAGSYSITVKATSGTATYSTTVTVAVQ